MSKLRIEGTDEYLYVADFDQSTMSNLPAGNKLGLVKLLNESERLMQSLYNGRSILFEEHDVFLMEHLIDSAFRGNVILDPETNQVCGTKGNKQAGLKKDDSHAIMKTEVTLRVIGAAYGQSLCQILGKKWRLDDDGSLWVDDYNVFHHPRNYLKFGEQSGMLLMVNFLKHNATQV